MTATANGYRELVTAPAKEPLTLADVRSHLRIDYTFEDNDLQFWIAAARELVEQAIPGGRALITQTWDQHVACWSDRMPLDIPPLQSVTSVKYYDSDGAQQTWSTSNYRVVTPTQLAGAVERAPDVTFPALQTDRPLPITVRYVAGYGDDPADVPARMRQALLLLVAHWHGAGREAVITGTISKEIEWGVRALLGSSGFGAYP